MKCFSFKVFVAAAFLHIAVTIWLFVANISRIEAYDRGETFPWLTAVCWTWMPAPVLLGDHFHVGPARFFYCLALPWSVLVALCCGFLVPYVLRRRHGLT
jgi:hypothetical protein